MDPIISLCDLSKRFPVRQGRTSFLTMLRNSMFHQSAQPLMVDALRDLSLDIMQGEKIGLVGNNGAGKTTLLKIIAGLLRPDQGRLEIRGTVTFLAGYGIGMLDDLSVEENAVLYGAIYGLPRRTVLAVMDELLDWAELTDFRNAKLKTLSSGMHTRLAFSVTRYIERDLFLLDEALSAADRSFQRKCESVFADRKKGDKTYVVATHNLGFVTQFCEKALWLHHGRSMAFGPAHEVIEAYIKTNGGGPAFS
jgi:ABC-type polysaccharide/polyol phosphate transport system ATPase subunit